MCISFIHIPDPEKDNEFRLVIGMNRDEFYQRPTASACWSGDLFGGWDKQEGREGGTWLACRASGHVALLTNIFTGGNIDKNAKGRGFLVTDYLRTYAGNAKTYLEDIDHDDAVYNPFNLVVLEPESEKFNYQLWLYSRGREGHTDCCPPTRYTSGTFGISNHPANKKFIKSLQGEKMLEKILDVSKTREDLFCEIEKLLKNDEVHWPDSQIQEQAVVKGSPGPLEPYVQFLSSICLSVPQVGYGTRTHSIIIVDKHKKLYFKEITLQELETNTWKTTEEVIELTRPSNMQ